MKTVAERRRQGSEDVKTLPKDAVLFSACFHDTIIAHHSRHYKAFLGTVFQ